MSKGFITGTNEELIKAYKESRDESYLKELIEANKGLINLLVSPYLTSIPNSELEDLTSESYIPMLRAIEDYDPEQGVVFSTLLKVYVRQHLNRLYNEATRQKRFTGTTPDSLDRLSEINKEGGTETDSTFEVECKDFSSVEFMDLLDSLLDCQHFFRQIFLGYFSDIVQAFDTLRKNVCGDDYTSLHNPIVLSSVLPAYGMFHSIQILFL